MADAKIILYTNHRCPWAHRAHIALSEIKVPFEEVIIDLDTPRTAEYLAINPRGLVPALKYNGEIITESAVVSQFLVDAFPSHLEPNTGSPEAALKRARINFFVDAFIGKFQGAMTKAFTAKNDEEAKPIVEAAVGVLVKEVEPLLSDAKPFFGGSDKLTMAEVLTGSFIIRMFSYAKGGLYSSALIDSFGSKAPNFYKWANAVAVHPSVTNIYNEDDVISHAKARLSKARAAVNA